MPIRLNGSIHDEVRMVIPKVELLVEWIDPTPEHIDPWTHRHILEIDGSWDGEFRLGLNEVREIEAVGTYDFLCDDGRRGQITLVEIEATTGLVHFISCGPLA